MNPLKFLKIIGILSLGLLIPLTTYAKSFYDVPVNYKYNQAISQLSDLDIVNGYGDGSFQPERTISRAEAVKLLIVSIKPDTFVQDAVANINQYGQGFIPFYDVSSSDWHAPYVVLAQQYEIVRGYSDGFFKPNQALNFAEGLKVILESYGIDTRRIRYSENPLLYVNGSDWFARYFTYAYNKNLINREKFYHPAQPMTRGEFSEILYRLKTIKEQGLDEYISTQKLYSDEYTITIPRLNLINIKVSFADPYDAKSALAVLKDGLGHYLSPPGSGKKMVLFGHSSGYNWDSSNYKQILRQMDRLEVGDRLYINYQEKGYVYQVANQEVLPAENLNAIMKDYGYEEIALYTCWPPDNISHRYVIYAPRV